ncbi:MAG: hypothetical protein ACK4N5_22155 [Myxococcales bacterium]
MAQYPDADDFVIPPDRSLVTGEPPRSEEERWMQQQYMSFHKMGGGYIPPTHRWIGSPKERQDAEGAK